MLVRWRFYSASQGSWQPWAGRHAVRAIVGMALVVCIAFIHFDFIKRMSYVFLAAAILVLLAVMVIGTGQGVSRWISIGGVNFQPSEPAKLAVILALARYFSSQPHERMRSFMWYLPAFAIIAVPFAMICETTRFRNGADAVIWRACCGVFGRFTMAICVWVAGGGIGRGSVVMVAAQGLSKGPRNDFF